MEFSFTVSANSRVASETPSRKIMWVKVFPFPKPQKKHSIRKRHQQHCTIASNKHQAHIIVESKKKTLNEKFKTHKQKIKLFRTQNIILQFSLISRPLRFVEKRQRSVFHFGKSFHISFSLHVELERTHVGRSWREFNLSFQELFRCDKTVELLPSIHRMKKCLK